MMGSAPLAGKTALVTGAARRLGRAIAYALAERGADVIVHCNSSIEEAARTRDKVLALQRRCWVLRADLADTVACVRLARECLEVAAAVQVIINSASSFDRGRLAEVSSEQVARSMQINALAPLILTRELMTHLPPGESGRVVNLLDAFSAGYQREHVAYNLSKRALSALTAMMALEFAPHVTVNAVAPGFILAPPGEPEDSLDALASKTPLGRRGEVGEVVEAVIYLVSAGYVTGQTIYVDGGGHLKAPCFT